MSVREVTYYQGVCDWPGCDATTENLGHDYSAWGDPGACRDDMRDGDWHESEDGTKQWCDKHPVQWESDPFIEWPEPPFVLLHDPGESASFIGDRDALDKYRNGGNRG